MHQLKLRKRVDYHGRMLTFVEISKLSGCSETCVHGYYKKHKTLEGFDTRNETKNARRSEAQTKRFLVRGELLSYEECAERFGGTKEQVRCYLRNHGTLDYYEERGRRSKPERCKKKVIYHGELMTFYEIADKCGIKPQSVASYFRKYGTMENFDRRHEIAREAYARAGVKQIEVDGRQTTYKELANEYDVPIKTMRRRMEKRNSPDVDLHSQYARRDRKIKLAMNGGF